MNDHTKNYQLEHGDCLAVMRDMDADSVDLIYLDPPFNTGRVWVGANGMKFDDNFNSRKDEYVSFNEVALHDLFAATMRLANNAMRSYLVFLAARLIEMRRLLKPTGSIYLHCDDTAGAYIKLLMDGVFGIKNYRNTIIWRRSYGKGTNQETKSFGSITDNIYFYGASDKVIVDIPKIEPLVEPVFPYEDQWGGRYRKVACLYRDSGLGSRPTFTWRGYRPELGWRVSFENLERMYAEHRIHFTKANIPYRKQYVDEYEGVAVGDLWNDIAVASGNERVGCPTQKPVALLERIIAASSNRGSCVLDPFCGSGTTGIAAVNLGRAFIGIDANADAVKLAQTRLTDATKQEALL